jgi:hypothetical protein
MQNAWGNVKEAGKKAVDKAGKTNPPADKSIATGTEEDEKTLARAAK